jgi:hypothetical protein
VKKPVKCGCDFVRGPDWNPVVRTRLGAAAMGMRTMPEDLRRLGFGVSVCDCGDYFRISYGRKC